MPDKGPPKETNQLAKYVLDVSIGEAEKIDAPAKNPHAQVLSKLGASKGNTQRAKNLSARKWEAFAKKEAQARWDSAK